ncbi:hypothetical protein [Microbacterium sp. G2-8]|uniref:hypothetical protein n=1 Tax=Microbacterium sp. G2-8 TaxID=2842454 RepID=UPI001C8ADD4F|nr:hypothetical protein [Microbacterium sp. G2-8]
MLNSAAAVRPSRRDAIAAFFGLDARPVRVLLVVLLALDAVLLVAHVSHWAFGEPSDPLLNLDLERGYGEQLFTFTMFGVCVLLLWAARRFRAPVLVGWLALFAFIVLDDWFLVHERMGEHVAETFAAVSHRMIGELIYLAAAGLVLAIVIAVLHVLTRGIGRAISANLLVLFLWLVVLSVGVDPLHELLHEIPVMDASLALIEDGGEIVMASLLFVSLFALVACDHVPVVGARLGRLLGVAEDWRVAGRTRLASV